jgi:hypothetical protein
MSDEIRNNEDGKMDELEKWFNQQMQDGKLGKCPNLSNLPMEKKEKIAQGAMAHCAEILMKTYLSLGLNGEAIMGLQDGITRKKFKLQFKAFNDEESDEHFDGGGL